MTDLDWTTLLDEQLSWHWDHHLRPRFEGLTDAEYFWEPVDGCWSLRPAAESRTPMAAGGGPLRLDYAFPEPAPAPVTTIAWRLCHLIVGVLGMRNAAHFGAAPLTYADVVYPDTAADALAELDRQYERWIAGVRSLGSADLARPVGDKEPFPEAPMAALVLHIHREVIHHGAEISLLRDLYQHQP